MTDNKLTDEMIIKALEIHGNEKFDNCEGCPYLEGDCCTGFSVYSKPYRDVLDLINRQKAEDEESSLKIETQANTIKILETALEKKQAEVDKYKKTVGKLYVKDDGFVASFLNGVETEYIPKKVHKIWKNMAVRQAKSEALKEFAERLKSRASRYSLGILAITDEAIDNLVKEMGCDTDV